MDSRTGQRLRALREKAGYSQEEVAKLLGIGRTTYLKYETGENRPVRKLKELSKLFNVSSDYIMGLSDYMRIAEVHGSGDRVDVYAEVDGDKSPSYYHDPEVAQIAQAMHDAPGMRVMFDASRRLSKESIEEVQNFIKFQLAKEGKL